MKKIIDEFKSFALKGNVLDLAVGVIIGGAFGKIVTSLVNDIIMPCLGFVIGKVNFSALKYIIVQKQGGIEELSIRYGIFLQSVIDFIIISASIFIFVKLINSFRIKSEKNEAKAEPTKQEQLLAEIRDILKNK